MLSMRALPDAALLRNNILNGAAILGKRPNRLHVVHVRDGVMFFLKKTGS